MLGRLVFTGALFFCLFGCERAPEETPPVVYSPAPTVDSLIESVLSTQGEFADMSFRKVVEASTGNTVILFDPGSRADLEILEGITEAMEEIVVEFSKDSSVTNTEKRINEVSSHFEEALRHHLNANPALSCDFPKTASGKIQRSGYPDLRIVHRETGRVAYLDPKLVETGSLDSSLRTFYFTPKGETNKVLEDAHHLLIGIEHDGNTGNWKFLRWHLVDLAEFEVRLKAEFQASNKDLYQEKLIISDGVNPEFIDGGDSQ